MLKLVLNRLLWAAIGVNLGFLPFMALAGGNAVLFQLLIIGLLTTAVFYSETQ